MLKEPNGSAPTFSAPGMGVFHEDASCVDGAALPEYVTVALRAFGIHGRGRERESNVLGAMLRASRSMRHLNAKHDGWKPMCLHVAGCCG